MKITASSLAYYRRQLRDPSLTALLIIQVLITFVLIPASAAGERVPPSVPVALLLLVISIVVFVAEGRWTMFAGVGLMAASGIVGYIERSLPGLPARIGASGMSLLAYATLGYLVWRAVFGPGSVNAHRIRGAVVLYLTIGLIFASVDRIIAETIPGAYRGVPPVTDLRGFNAAMTYFSFATLTTVGYGDITPVAPIARSIAMLEAIAGMLFPRDTARPDRHAGHRDPALDAETPHAGQPSGEAAGGSRGLNP
ncbi:MAG: ion channel [Acetobacteraceae bacterium]